MAEIAERPTTAGSRAFLIGAHVGAETTREGQSLLNELGELVWTLGLPIAGTRLVKVQKPQASYWIGSGKAQEIIDEAKAAGAGVIVFDNELSPGQQRNWEQLSGLAVIDREEVILDIFAHRAQTREARLQIELARAEYSLPRLARAWGHLNRQQGGGLGGKGEGESQLEIDRRLTRRRIEKLREELEAVRAQRATQRKRRQRIPLPRASIVGYTNAGKSSLLKKLTGADLLIEDKLFATLDPTTRRVEVPSGQTLLLTDTVGFVRRLPTRLVEAFKATLEEAMLAEFLVHVLDASDPEIFEFHRTTMSVLEELGAADKPILTVLNKVDLLESAEARAPLQRHFHDPIFISTKTGEGLDELLHRCGGLLADRPVILELLVPHERGDMLALAHRAGRVRSSEVLDEGTRLVAVLPPRVAEQLKDYVRGVPSAVELAKVAEEDTADDDAEPDAALEDTEVLRKA